MSDVAYRYSNSLKPKYLLWPIIIECKIFNIQVFYIVDTNIQVRVYNINKKHVKNM